MISSSTALQMQMQHSNANANATAKRGSRSQSGSRTTSAVRGDLVLRRREIRTFETPQLFPRFLLFLLLRLFLPTYGIHPSIFYLSKLGTYSTKFEHLSHPPPLLPPKKLAMNPIFVPTTAPMLLLLLFFSSFFVAPIGTYISPAIQYEGVYFTRGVFCVFKWTWTDRNYYTIETRPLPFVFHGEGIPVALDFGDGVKVVVDIG